MSAVLIGFICLAGYLLAYLTYGRFIAGRLFRLDPHRRTPADELRDGVDHVPSRPLVLFGHHFATIAGLGPLLGPAVAVIWGWLPALLWVFFGSIFFGAVHDLSALAVSLRHQGRSIGDVTRELVGARAQWVFLILIFFALSLAMGVFTLIIATLFGGLPQPGARVPPFAHPEAVIPSFSLVVIAIGIGLLVYRRRLSLSWATLGGLVLMMAMLVVGVRLPVTGVAHATWVVVLLLYALVASVLPVWLLLQPRDYLNSFQLYLGMGAMYIGLLVSRPEVVAPAVNRSAADPVEQITVDWRVRSNVWLRLVAASDGPFEANWGRRPSNPRSETRGTVVLRAPGRARRFHAALELHQGSPALRNVDGMSGDAVEIAFFDGSRKSYELPR